MSNARAHLNCQVMMDIKCDSLQRSSAIVMMLASTSRRWSTISWQAMETDSKNWVRRQAVSLHVQMCAWLWNAIHVETSWDFVWYVLQHKAAAIWNAAIGNSSFSKWPSTNLSHSSMINKTKQNKTAKWRNAPTLPVPNWGMKILSIYPTCSLIRVPTVTVVTTIPVEGRRSPHIKQWSMGFFTSSLRSNVSHFPPPFPFDLLQFQTIIEPSAAHQQLCRGVLQGERVITVKLASLMPKAAQQINRTLGSSWIFHQVQMIYTDNFSWHLHSAPFYTNGLFSWTRLVDAFGWLDQLVRDINI